MNPFLRLNVVLLSYFSFAGCATTAPLREYTLARSAIQSAKHHNAARYAPALWQEAENAFESGESLFRKGEYRDSQVHFEDAQEYAERAENVSRLQKLKSGEPQ